MIKNSITHQQILKGLRQLGLKTGDTVIVHSALSSFGKIAGGADTVIDALLKTVGQTGTIVMPTFGSSDTVFDHKKSDTNLGIIPQTFWKRPGVVRSRHPLASVAAIGPNAKILIDGHEYAKTAHGEGTPYYKLSQLGGKILLLGVDQDRNTFLHTVEEIAQALYLKPVTGKFIDIHGKTVTKTWPYFPGPHRDFIGLQSFLRKSGLVKEVAIGNCQAKLMDAAPLFETLLQKIKSQPDLFLSSNPNLPDGIWQRAALIKSKLAAWPFTLAADSQFAGKYIEEIIENLNATGIDHLVLSTLNNVPWYKIPQEKRNWYLQGLKNAGIKIAALKLVNICNVDIGKMVKDIHTNLLILPSTTDLARFEEIAAKVNVLIENVGITGTEMVAYVNRARKQHAKTSAAFNPLEFVQAGVNPFLTTYTKTNIKSMIGALYINDGLAAEERTALEEGLAEIKELISIMLCRTFSGLFILQGPSPAQFRQTALKFMQMYEEVR